MKYTNSFLACFCLLFAGRLVQAGTITYTDQTTASGTLGGTTFTSALLTLTFVGDTANVTHPSNGFLITMGAPTVTVTGIGTAGIFGSYEVFDNQNTPTVLFAVPSGATTLSTSNSAFGSYNLMSTFGPITGTSSFDGVGVNTSLGALIITSAGNSTFAANGGSGGSSTPEPSNFLLLGTGVAAGAFMLRRRGRKSRMAG